MELHNDLNAQIVRLPRVGSNKNRFNELMDLGNPCFVLPFRHLLHFFNDMIYTQLVLNYHNKNSRQPGFIIKEYNKAGCGGQPFGLSKTLDPLLYLMTTFKV